MNHLFNIYTFVSVQAAVTGLPEMLFQGLDAFDGVSKYSATSSVETSREKETLKIVRWKHWKWKENKSE